MNTTTYTVQQVTKGRVKSRLARFLGIQPESVRYWEKNHKGVIPQKFNEKIAAYIKTTDDDIPTKAQAKKQTKTKETPINFQEIQTTMGGTDNAFMVIISKDRSLLDNLLSKIQ